MSGRHVKERLHGVAGFCVPCGKYTYPTRKDAKAALRRAHPGDHQTAYACPEGTGYWHFGHSDAKHLRGLPEQVAYKPGVAAGVARVAAASRNVGE
jgi:hypothetical protein